MEAIETLTDLTSPIGAFIRDWCIVGPTEQENVKRLFDAWSKWAVENGHKPGSASVFGRDLFAAEATIRPRGRGKTRFYQGIALTKDGEVEYQSAMEEQASR